MTSRDYFLGLLLETARGAIEPEILSLIKSASNINLTDRKGRTLLHKAIPKCSTNVIKELITQGANVNTQDENGLTPLHEAVTTDNKETICMLLYYGADVNILDGKGQTPFVKSLDTCIYCYDLGIAKLLLDHYTYFPGRFALMTTYQKLFKHPIQEPEMLGVIQQIWDKFDHNTMLMDKSMFLSLYLLESLFSIPAWIDCLCSMLSTQSATELMFYKFCLLDTYYVSNFSEVICALLSRNARRRDRLVVISLWLNFGARICVDDVRKMIEHFQLHEEVLLLISTAPVPLLTLLFGAEQQGELKSYRSFQYVIILELIPEVRKARTFRTVMWLICKALTYFSWSNSHRLMMAEELRTTEHLKMVMDLMEKLPKMPSLVELCRTRILKITKTKVVRNEIFNPVDYHREIDKLDATHYVKDILHFKTPLYA